MDPPVRYDPGPPGYPLIRVRLGYDQDIFAPNEEYNAIISNNHPMLPPYFYAALGIGICLSVAWGVIEGILALARTKELRKVRETLIERKIKKVPNEIKSLDADYKLMDKKKFLSAACFYTVINYFKFNINS